MHRIGTVSFCANVIQTARVSGSAFVLSRNLSLYVLQCRAPGVPIALTDDYAGTLFDERGCYFDTFLALVHCVTQRAEE